MSGWRRCKLGDLLEIKHGFAFKGEFFSDEGPFVLLTPGNFREEGGLKLKGDKEKFYTGDFPSEFLLNRGDLLVAMTDLTQDAPILGSPAFTPEDGRFLHNQRLGKVVNLSPNELSPEFLFFLLNTTSVRSQIKGSATGATVRHTSPSRIYDVAVRIPPLPIQRRIAGILSAYDELIENSQRRIKILETMARAVYREWFVHFRFPGHESVPRVPSPLGEIPQGWEVKTLGDISSYISRGISPRYDEEGDSVVINQKCVRDQRLNLEPARRQSKAIPSEKRVCFGDVLINSTGVGTLGRVAQVYEIIENCTVDSHVTIARAAHATDLDFYGCCVLSLQETLERLGVGATGQTELGRGAITSIQVVVPTADLQGRFGEVARGIRMAAMICQMQIQNLRRTRDLLLPRLLSGELQVGDLKK